MVVDSTCRPFQMLIKRRKTLSSGSPFSLLYTTQHNICMRQLGSCQPLGGLECQLHSHAVCKGCYCNCSKCINSLQTRRRRRTRTLEAQSVATEATRNWVLLYLPTSVAIFLLPFCSTSLKRYSSGRAFPFRADTTELPLLITGHHQTAVALRACVCGAYVPRRRYCSH